VTIVAVVTIVDFMKILIYHIFGFGVYDFIIVGDGLHVVFHLN